MRDLAGTMREALSGVHGADLDLFGDLLHEGWELKRSVLSSISTSLVDDWYAKARAEGARGGKLLGAGGGGFLLVFAEPDRHEAIRCALGKPRELPVGLDPLGSRIIFIGKRA
jgi:D-glycero-alpha-D-manno-heptose-7-phosphate kinase